jgi:hypothetical protein
MVSVSGHATMHHWSWVTVYRRSSALCERRAERGSLGVEPRLAVVASFGRRTRLPQGRQIAIHRARSARIALLGNLLPQAASIATARFPALPQEVCQYFHRLIVIGPGKLCSFLAGLYVSWGEFMIFSIFPPVTPAKSQT